MNLLSFDLNLLRVLDALLETQSTTAAADRVGLSQPAVSAALKRLRYSLDDPLFVREGQRLVPTNFAQSLALPLRQTLDQLQSLLSGAESFDPARANRTFRIAGEFRGAATAVRDLSLNFAAVEQMEALGQVGFHRPLAFTRGVSGRLSKDLQEVRRDRDIPELHGARPRGQAGIVLRRRGHLVERIVEHLRGKPTGLRMGEVDGVVLVPLIVCYSILGREEEAKVSAAEVLRLEPDFSARPAHFGKTAWHCRHGAYRHRRSPARTRFRPDRALP